MLRTSRESTNASPLTPHVLLTGDVMADALQFTASKASAQSDILVRLGIQPQAYLLATVHRAENTNDPDRLCNIMGALSELAVSEAVVLPLHPRTKKILDDNKILPLTPHSTLSYCSSPLTPYPSPGVSHPSLKIIDPVGYFDMIAIEQSARMILTDSGGIQKEAYWLKVPCITLRDETEWVETVEAGWNVLTGAKTQKIIKAVHTFQSPAAHPALFGDGQAAEKILDTLCQELSIL